MTIPIAVCVWCLSTAAAQGPEDDAMTRLRSVQKAAVEFSPELQVRLHEASIREAEARSEAAAINPYVEWQSEGLGSDRRLNAQDSLRVGTPFNFFGQMGPARALARTAEDGLGVMQSAAIRTTTVEISRRWVDLAAALERLRVRQVRLERLDAALALLEARHQLGEVAGTEVAQLDLEYTDAASRLAAARAEVEELREMVRELCGDTCPDPRFGDLESLTEVTRSPAEAEINERSLDAGVPMRDAGTRVEIEAARARMASAAAWGRPMIEAEWEHFPDLGPVPGYDAWGFRIAVPLPLGSAGARQRAAARERIAAAEASRETVARHSLVRARAALAKANGAESRLVAVASTAKNLPRIEESLEAQFRLGVLSYLEYVYGMVRHDELLLTAIDARSVLLQARIELGYLLDDPAVFPTVADRTGEDS
jgi:outer membrane protein TolC